MKLNTAFRWRDFFKLATSSTTKSCVMHGEFMFLLTASSIGSRQVASRLRDANGTTDASAVQTWKHTPSGKWRCHCRNVTPCVKESVKQTQDFTSFFFQIHAVCHRAILSRSFLLRGCAVIDFSLVDTCRGSTQEEQARLGTVTRGMFGMTCLNVSWTAHLLQRSNASDGCYCTQRFEHRATFQKSSLRRWSRLPSSVQTDRCCFYPGLGVSGTLG